MEICHGCLSHYINNRVIKIEVWVIDFWVSLGIKKEPNAPRETSHKFALLVFYYEPEHEKTFSR